MDTEAAAAGVDVDSKGIKATDEHAEKNNAKEAAKKAKREAEELAKKEKEDQLKREQVVFVRVYVLCGGGPKG